MNRSIGVAIPLALVLLMFLVFIACTSGPTNSNQTPVNRAELAPPPGQNPNCVPGDSAANRAAAMRLHYSNANNANSGDADLELQREKGFYLEFEEAPGNTVVLRVRGRLASTDNGGKKPHLDKLIKKYEWYLKHGCADRISFESTAALASPGFEWSVCSGSQVACPNGTCAEPGSCPTLTNTNSGNVGNSNSNSTNGNSNVSTNSNSNANINRAANARSSP